MQIEIKVYGNPGLYQHIQDAYRSQSTKHRTFTGAARRLVTLNRKAKDWARASGRWGGWKIVVDGIDLTKPLDIYDSWTTSSVEDILYNCPVTVLAKEIADRFAECQREAE